MGIFTNLLIYSIISGYFAVHMVKKIQNGTQSFPVFFAKRVIRLVPLVLITAVGDQIVRIIYELVAEKPFGTGLSMWGTIISGLAVQTGGAFIPQGVNNPTWYISVLLICYALTYLLTYVSKRLKVPCWYFFAAMVLLGAGSLSYSFNYPFLNFYTARGYLSFFLGLCLGELLIRYPLHQNKKFQICNMVVMILFWVMYVFYPTAVDNDQRFLTVFVVWPSLIVMMKSSVAEKIFGGRFWGTLSAWSFDTYVWHAVLIKVLLTICNITGTEPFLNSTAMVCFAIVCFVVGALSHYCIEKPLYRRLSKRIQVFEENSNL